MQINAKTSLCAVIGNPIEHSLSPAIHNAGYKALGINFAYVAFKVEKIKEAVEGIRSLGIRGVSVTIPHKETVVQFLDKIDPLAEKIGAVNTILNDNGVLTGMNTDYAGAMRAIEEKVPLNNKQVTVVGSGGAAKGIAFGLRDKGAQVHIINRTGIHAQNLAEAVGATHSDFTDTKKIRTADIIINATSVGMTPNNDLTVITKDLLNSAQLVMDIVYNPMETVLINDAKEVGCQIIYGYKMLLYQAVTQFELFTNHKAPVAVMEEALLKGLGH